MSVYDCVSILIFLELVFKDSCITCKSCIHLYVSILIFLELVFKVLVCNSLHSVKIVSILIFLELVFKVTYTTYSWNIFFLFQSLFSWNWYLKAVFAIWKMHKNYYVSILIFLELVFKDMGCVYWRSYFKFQSLFSWNWYLKKFLLSSFLLIHVSILIFLELVFKALMGYDDNFSNSGFNPYFLGIGI